MINDIDTRTMMFYHPETGDEYKVWVKFSYDYYPGDYWTPPHEGKAIIDAEVESINGEYVGQELPDWIHEDEILSNIEI